MIYILNNFDCVTPRGFGGESVNCSSIGFQALIIIVSGVLNYLIRTALHYYEFVIYKCNTNEYMLAINFVINIALFPSIHQVT